jgi:DNA polymerase III delta prime subunit
VQALADNYCMDNKGRDSALKRLHAIHEAMKGTTEEEVYKTLEQARLEKPKAANGKSTVKLAATGTVEASGRRRRESV